jgi:ankyrin repeat protein
MKVHPPWSQLMIWLVCAGAATGGEAAPGPTEGYLERMAGVATGAGLPAAHAAVLMEAEEMLAERLAGGAPVDEVSPGGDRALPLAMRLRQDGMVRRLCWAGADLRDCEIEGQPLMILAALRRQTEVMRTLLLSGAQPDARTSHPVLSTLVEEQGLKDLQWHLQRDRNLTPIMICAAHGDADGVDLLMRAGASQSLHTKVNKRYAINFASVQGYTYIMQLVLGRRPGSEPENRVVVNLSSQKAELYRDGMLVDTTKVSTGRKGYSTPKGTFVITNKHQSWKSTIYHVAMPWFMRLNCGAIGLHAGNIPGYPASHGCIRLPYAKAKAFFGQLRTGDVVEVVP